MKTICGFFGQLNQRLYQSKTSSVQILSGLCLIFFGLTFVFSGESLYQFKTYEHFRMMHPCLISAVLLVVGSAQLVLALRLTSRSNVLSGWFLQLNGLLWWLLCGAYAAAYPPLNPAVLVTGLFGFVCMTTGRGLVEKNHNKG